MTPPIQVTQGSSMDAGLSPDAGIPPADAGADERPQNRNATAPMGDASVPRDAVPPPPNPLPRTLGSFLAQLSAAQRELQRVFSDQNILGPHYVAWNAARNTTYFNISLAILRTRYYLQGSQTDVSSFRTPLEAWVREAQTSTDPVIRETLPRFLETLRQLQESSIVARSGMIIGMVEELQQPPLLPARPPQTPSPSPGPVAPPSPQTRRRNRRDPHPDAGVRNTPQATPEPPPQQPVSPPPASPSSPDAGIPPPPPPRRGRTILPPTPDAGSH